MLCLTMSDTYSRRHFESEISAQQHVNVFHIYIYLFIILFYRLLHLCRGYLHS